MSTRRAAALSAVAVPALGAAYVLQRAAARGWRVGEDELAAEGRTLPTDLRHHFVTLSDGGRVHAVERDDGPWGGPGAAATTVLVHGAALSLGVWAPQLRTLGGRVVALGVRGHGQSRPGSDGYSLARLGADLLEAMAALDVRGAVLCGHAMGGMVAQLLAVDRPEDLARHVDRLVLVATSARGAGGPWPGAAARGARAVLRRAERRGRGPFPKGATVWLARGCFGSAPRPADVELVRSMLDAMSPAALAALVPQVAGFDVRGRLGAVALPTAVVAGSRDAVIGARAARDLARRVGAVQLDVLPGCGHMVMLERPGELAAAMRPR